LARCGQALRVACDAGLILVKALVRKAC